MNALFRMAVASMLLASASALAQTPGNYPSRPIRFVVGFAAGGPTDVIARITGQDIGAALGQTVVVENRAGANAQIATELVARATPDGHTLLFSSLSLLVNAILLESKARYDPFKDFMPISNAAVLPMVVVTSPATKLNSLKELLSAAKAKPGAITYGAPGHGGSGHLAGALLENLSGTKMTTIPFRGNGPALTDVMAGQVTFMFYPMVGIADHVASKRLRALAVGTAKRHADFSEVPTMAESGFPGFEETAPWVGLLAPTGTPAAIVDRLSAEMRKSLAKPETITRLKALGAITMGDTPGEYLKFLKKDHERWARVIKASGVKAE
ncbi:MAG: tripartite tricarboxylate transporter substrate binding protein [Burkholderiales bacterium]